MDQFFEIRLLPGSTYAHMQNCLNEFCIEETINPPEVTTANIPKHPNFPKDLVYEKIEFSFYKNDSTKIVTGKIILDHDRIVVVRITNHDSLIDLAVKAKNKIRNHFNSSLK